MLYFNNHPSKIALVRYIKNDYEKVLEGTPEVEITIPSTFSTISSDVLKGLNGVLLNYSGSVTGYPWGANEGGEALPEVLDAIIYQNVTEDEFTELLEDLDGWNGSVYYRGSTALLSTVLNNIKNGE